MADIQLKNAMAQFSLKSSYPVEERYSYLKTINKRNM